MLKPNLPIRDSIPNRVVKAEFAFPNLLEQGWLALIIEGWVAPQENEEHHPSTPQVYCRTVYQAWGALHEAHTA